ncbi:hypothetical protein JW979_03280 [bacterium]|nr:hypothetical protein [candidate division CSSED10-310 bacterium]
MKIMDTIYIVKKGAFSESDAWKTTLEEIHKAIRGVVWPDDKKGLYFKTGSTGKGRGQGNGVKLLSKKFQEKIKELGWNLETRVKISKEIRVGRIDATKTISTEGIVAVEWETGNVSSSHRSMNKLAIAIMNNSILAGIVIMPNRSMYKFLTDRIGNLKEIEPYFQLWQSIQTDEGILAIIPIEHDGVKDDVPRIPKGTNGLANP